MNKLALLGLLFSLVACGGSGDDPPLGDLPPSGEAPDAAPTGPVLDAVFLRGVEGATQVRQGAGEVELHIRGVRLLGGTVRVAGEAIPLISHGEELVIARWDVAHGMVIGPRDVSVETAAGAASREGAVEVMAITVVAGAEGGDGTPASPFGDLRASLDLSADGDELRILGDFSVDGSLALPAGVAMIGDEASLTGAAGEEGLALAERSRLIGVDVLDYGGVCLSVEGKDVVIADLHVGSCGIGISIDFASGAQLDRLLLTEHDIAAIAHGGGRLVASHLDVRTGEAPAVRVFSGVTEISSSSFRHLPVTGPGPHAEPQPLLSDERPTPFGLGLKTSITLRQVTMNDVKLAAPATLVGPLEDYPIAIANKTTIDVEE